MSIPKTMKAVYFTGDQHMEIRDVPIPMPKAGEVLVKLRTAALCGSDIHFYRSRPEILIPNIISGHEPAGEIAALGEGVHHLAVGDRVCIYHFQGCGTCEHCISGHINTCQMARHGCGWDLNGSNAEYMIMNALNCMKLPDELSFADGSIIGCIGATAYSGLCKLNLSGRDLLVVYGLGAVGQACVLVAKGMGATVVGVEMNEYRLNFAKELGCDYVINSAKEDIFQAVMRITNGHGADKSIETTGVTPLRKMMVQASAIRGHIVMLGFNEGCRDPLDECLCMFNPYKFDDPSAINNIDAEGLHMEEAVWGSAAAAHSILSGNARIIGMDGYATAPFEIMRTLMSQAAGKNGQTVAFFSTSELWREEAELTAELKKQCLPDNRETDPSLLYGKLFDGTYEDLMDPIAIELLKKKIEAFRAQENVTLVIYGVGALCEQFAPLCDRRVWLDVTPIRAILNVKEGKYQNIGIKSALSFQQAARRCYFIDFELSLLSRERLIVNGQIDDYVAASVPENMTVLPMKLVRDIFYRGLEYPFRCKPVYLEGVWGGYYIKRLRHLPDAMRNCAWVFDLIPMEVSVVYQIDGKELEFPFYTLIQAEAERLMGRESVQHFGRYFPIRFNYDDTYHSSGNMSIQCHPIRSYIRRENGEFDRQDESYYIVAAGQEAQTYLGFHDGVRKEQFFRDIKRSEQEHTPVNYHEYVNAVESKPGVQIMIPSGTIHASGRNQLVLEIGSLTVGSYTYKMYDYLRLDLDGNPRPLHTYHAENVIQMDRTASLVNHQLVQQPRIIRKGEDWMEYIVGEHPLLYFSLRNIRMKARYTDDTCGRFHVLSLVDGECVEIRSLHNQNRSYVQSYLDIIVIPAEFGPYEVINRKPGTTLTIHKTLLKDGFMDDEGQL